MPHVNRGRGNQSEWMAGDKGKDNRTKARAREHKIHNRKIEFEKAAKKDKRQTKGERHEL